MNPNTSAAEVSSTDVAGYRGHDGKSVRSESQGLSVCVEHLLGKCVSMSVSVVY